MLFILLNNNISVSITYTLVVLDRALKIWHEICQLCNAAPARIFIVLGNDIDIKKSLEL